MSRPAVSVVMPFAGTSAQAREAIGSLLRLEVREGDELILADNSGTVPATPGVLVVPALAERSPAHARNAGAERAHNDFVLFLDADCAPPAGLLDAYFQAPVGAVVGALAGDVVPAPGGNTLAARYGAARNFLSQEAHLAHPFRPRAAAANLMVRRAAFVELGGFYEGLRAAEDTDFSWRLPEAGWILQLRPEARVEHRYRATVSELRRQWRGYAAGRAWLARRYEGFQPEPALARALRRAWRRSRGDTVALRAPSPAAGGGARGADAARRAAGSYLALDALLAVDELVGFALSNRPARDRVAGRRVILVADRFPQREDPLVDFARTVERPRVEAAARPRAVCLAAAHEIAVDYREDDGVAALAAALAELVVRHPVRCALDLLRRRPGAPRLAALGPAALRAARDAATEPSARVLALGGLEVVATARRLAALAGLPLEEAARP